MQIFKNFLVYSICRGDLKMKDEWKIRWNWLKGFIEEEMFTAQGFSDGREIF